MNLIKADLYHLIKDRAFYVLIALTFLIPAVSVLMFPQMTAEKVIFQGLDSTIFCSVTGIMIALFVGKDYANNTIRNKICYGESRFKIMGVTFLESAAICLGFAAVSVLSSLLFGGTIGEWSFSSDFAAKFFCQIALHVAFSAVVAAITMSTKSAKTGLIVTLLLSVLLAAVSQMLPMLAVTNAVAAALCRVLYSAVSVNLLNSTGGAYTAASYSQSGVLTYTFDHLYLNAAIVAVAYIVLAIAVTAVFVKKHSYK